MQKMMTKELGKRTPKPYGTDGQGMDATAQARYFSLMGGLAGWEWFLTEYDPETGEAFGFIKGFAGELGYFSLAEFERMNESHGLQVIERDTGFTPCRLSEIA